MWFKGSKDVNRKQIQDILALTIGRPAGTGAAPPGQPQPGQAPPGQRPQPGQPPHTPSNKFLQVYTGNKMVEVWHLDVWEIVNSFPVIPDLRVYRSSETKGLAWSVHDLIMSFGLDVLLCKVPIGCDLPPAELNHCDLKSISKCRDLGVFCIFFDTYAISGTTWSWKLKLDFSYRLLKWWKSQVKVQGVRKVWIERKF